MDSLMDRFDIYCRAAILFAAYELSDEPKDQQWVDKKLENMIQQGLITKDMAVAIKTEFNKQLVSRDRDDKEEKSDAATA